MIKVRRSINCHSPLMLLALLVLCLPMLIKHISDFESVGKDYKTHIKAIETLLAGQNPYYDTIASYNDPYAATMGSHGYAYLPGFLYLNTALLLMAQATSIPYQILWKLPNFLSELVIGLLLYKYFHKKDRLLSLIFPILWFYNPYTLTRSGYTYLDSVPILFIFLSLNYLSKSDIKTGIMYSLSILFKPFGIILLPIFLYKSNNKVVFLVTGLVMFILSSLPFTNTLDNFLTFLQGSLLVHSNRVVQGRPFLFYISYFYKVEFFQIIPIRYYSLAALILPWLSTALLLLYSRVKDKFALSLIAFVIFYIFTPVLNRTYTIWFLPILFVGLYNEFYITKKYLILLPVVLYYTFFILYLNAWKYGFQIYRP